MADAVIQYVVRLPSVTGLSEDVTENVINCGVNGALGTTDVEDGLGWVRNFFTTAGAPTQDYAIGTRISSAISRAANACSVMAYSTTDLDGSTPLGSPVGSLSFTMPAAVAGGDLPNEVSTVLSFNGDLVDVPISEVNPTPPPATIRPQSRRRGRLFIGPLRTNVGAGDTAGIYRPSNEWLENLALAFGWMCGSFLTSDALSVGVWSKADADVYEVVGGYVDNAWDTQRRRGLGSTYRFPFVIA